jgi:hypothetical protein
VTILVVIEEAEVDGAMTAVSVEINVAGTEGW